MAKSGVFSAGFGSGKEEAGSVAKIVRRGFVPEDAQQFDRKSVRKLQEARKDLAYLLNRGYPMRQSLTFIGNRHQFSTRQRMALMRACCGAAERESRLEREMTNSLEGETFYIDGFNLIITLEAALSRSTILFCMDGTARDLCGLRGTYQVIDKTDTALRLIKAWLEHAKINKAVFMLDAPVSNSGRLKQHILKRTEGGSFTREVQLVDHVDTLLCSKSGVVTSDSFILDRCGGWVNLARVIIKDAIPALRPVDLSGGLKW
ncbi:DUF434 domain-containing protein [Sporolactobacillus sp. THM7-7]|nr:DUF434 domain-containing protein [Sporolactobacillus sp. THM7-7]